MNEVEKFAKTIIDRYYSASSEALYLSLWTHSRCVADKALAIIDSGGAPGADRRFVELAALLHDVGIVGCHAPSIHCVGSEPYIRHGMIGAGMLRNLAVDPTAPVPEGMTREAFAELMERLARVCERHTGSGLTAEEIEQQRLPLPRRDFLPETAEERLVCYADKFFSKSGDLTAEKPLEEVERQMAAHGAASLQRFRELL